MKLNIEKNIYGIDLNNLVVMGKRANNPKRSFLFVSKVLGKHIELKPDICRVMGYLLASRIYGENSSTKKFLEQLQNSEEKIKDQFENYYEDRDSFVIGFAETATGLGLSVASAIKGSKYLTTTRENIDELKSIFDFEEEHSHATTHKCYLEKREELENAKRIILVDDEITTGNSMVNIIKELKKVTKTKEFIVLTILDWRNKGHKNNYEKFMEEENIDINVLSLISGEVKEQQGEVFKDNNGIELTNKAEVTPLNIMERVVYKGEKSYIKKTGRFSLEFNDIEEIEERAREIAKTIEEKIGIEEKTLVLGHGENIYIPSRVASYLSGEVYFKSTTRSPIYCEDEGDYPIREKHYFNFDNVTYYFYNKSFCEDNYDRVILLTEDNLDIQLTNNIVIFKL